MKELKLKNPIKINGELVEVVTYDANEIDGTLFAQAEAKRRENGGTAAAFATEVDFGMHQYLGYAAIIAVNPSYSFEDMLRLKGRDVMEVVQIGRNFTLKLDEESQQKDSAEPTETMPESTTPAQQNSKKSE